MFNIVICHSDLSVIDSESGCQVTAFTSSENKREEALSLGAHHVLNSRDADEIKSA